MSVVIETTLGDITVDLYVEDRPRTCLNFLKLCKIKYYNYHLFHTVSRSFIAQTGDPTGSRNGGESIFGVLDGPSKRFFENETKPRIKHTKMGLISFVGNEDHMIGSQFFFTLDENLTYLDEKHCVFGEVVEGFDILELINEAICDNDDRPYQDIRITHTVILDDPYPDPRRLVVPSRSPSPSAERLQGGRIAADEEIDETAGRSAKEVSEMSAEREAKARATILEMVGDIPDAEMAPPENVLFVCKLNPVTTDDDLEIIFSRFGKIKSCEVIRDRKTDDSLQYAFVEFADQKSCEEAYFKMDNVLIDDRRIHVDFSQSVSKMKWLGKGRGVAHFDEKGRTNDKNNDIGKSNYRGKNNSRNNKGNVNRTARRYSRSPTVESSSSRSRIDVEKSYSKEKRIDRAGSSRKSRSRSPRKRHSRSPRRERDFEDFHKRERKNGKDDNRYTPQNYVNRSRSPSTNNYQSSRSRYDGRYDSRRKNRDYPDERRSNSSQSCLADYRRNRNDNHECKQDYTGSRKEEKTLKRPSNEDEPKSKVKRRNESSDSSSSSSEDEKASKRNKKKRDTSTSSSESDTRNSKKRMKEDGADKKAHKKRKEKQSESDSSSDDTSSSDSSSTSSSSSSSTSDSSDSDYKEKKRSRKKMQHC